jgi:uncharacterized protein (TIGR02271 family)
LPLKKSVDESEYRGRGEMVTNNAEFVKNKARINDLLEKLRNKLKSFEVVNLKGQTLGRINDFTLDRSRRLYMVMPQLEAQANSPVKLLSSKYIQKVDTSNRVLFVDISLAEFQKLPLYYPSNDKATEFSKHSLTPAETQSNITGSSESQEFGKTQPPNEQSLTTEKLEEVGHQSDTESDDTLEVLEEQTIRLLEERLIINRSKRKIGEIVVRKQIETRIVEVPIQSEKLIIDKVGSESKQPLEVERLPVDQVSHDQGTEISAHSSMPPGTQVGSISSSKTQPSVAQFSTTEKLEEVDNPSFSESGDTLEVMEEEIIRLLEERLVVNRSKWKVGEVVVRKEIETQIVQVPIRREKLIIEQVSPETKQIAEIDLGKGEITGVELTETPSLDTRNSSVASSDKGYTVTGEFLSPRAASNLLEAIALQKRHGCQKVRVELVLEDQELQEAYQKMFDRCCQR